MFALEKGHCVRADDNEQERIVEDAGGRAGCLGAEQRHSETTEQLLRDSEGSTASLYGLRAAVLG
jgi:hypothetical protein